MEQRHHEQRGRLQARCHLRRRRSAHACGDPEHDDVRQVGDHLAVRERRALRPARRSRRVDDREEVVFVEWRLVEIVGAGGEIRRTARRADAAARHRRSRTRARSTGCCAEPVGDHASAARVADQHLRAGVVRDRTRAPRPSTTRSTARRPRPTPRTPRTRPPSRGCSPSTTRRGRRHGCRAARARTRPRAPVVCSPKVMRWSPCTTKSTSARPRSARSARAAFACASRRPGSATPSTSSTTISNGPPGPVSCARTGSGSVTAAKTTSGRDAVRTSPDAGVTPLRAARRRTTRARCRCRPARPWRGRRGPAGTPGRSASSGSPLR